MKYKIHVQIQKAHWNQISGELFFIYLSVKAIFPETCHLSIPSCFSTEEVKQKDFFLILYLWKMF